ncbi:phytoene desaturase family protein [Frigoriflavimonas asaccharolytica]|uniref:Phytoene desaturase n=1 Tax=Frigoriflavimonas asaccharolytica TaxID=2735899 RepID=A0A8J8K8E9_9FLAO|nr:phytoene desaturase family protein [Frigoriflavimonas asaccharolytica]NRS91877.1 phytoene desaturase [Frigoriflavimonas asaccharolytica]
MNVIIIGSGFSSLASACYMAKAGHKVLVLEKNEQIGGRASMLEIEGFHFDMGPSWYWMPDVFEKFFSDFGKKVTDYYHLEKLSPAYRVYFGEQDYIDIEDEPEKIIQTFENIETGSGKHLRNFLKKSEANYKIAMQDVVYNPGKSLLELVSWDTAIRLPLFVQNISQSVRKNIKNSKLRSILEFPVLFLGAKPSDTPAFYNFMNFADFGMGTWYPKGGFNAVAKGIFNLAKELGVEFVIEEEVKKLQTENGVVTNVITSKNSYKADIVISGADYAHTEKLLKQEEKNYSENYWQKKTFAPSSFLYYVAFDKKIKSALHHNLFFDTDFEAHAEEIYDHPKLPKAPLFYANFSGKTDDTLAPEGKDVGFFLIPVAVDLVDSPEIHDEYFEKILERFEKNTGENLRNSIIFKKSFGVQDFKDRYNSCRGNAYGLANTLLQTSILRPQIDNKKIKNLFYTGQLTVPGPGVPPALISGKVVTDYILKKIKANSFQN